ncbi:hypothetical protein C8R44DRAFT_139759 [Mycena epipterygia]|nr:hypothetical protein C8R44DRAFT_139759 [Mycena epipterygia]
MRRFTSCSQVFWNSWARADGTSTTWEGPDTTSEHLPTTAWTEKRLSELPDTPDVVLWGTTDIVNTRTRERKQGFEETTDEERAEFEEDFDTIVRRMEELAAAATATEEASPTPVLPTIPLPRRYHQINAEAGPSRLRPSATLPALPSNSTFRAPSSPATASTSRLPRYKTPPLTPIPTPRAPLPRPASPTPSVSSASSIQFIGYGDPTPASKPSGTKRKVTSPVNAAPPPPPKRRALPVPRDPSASMPSIPASAYTKPCPAPLASSSRPSNSTSASGSKTRGTSQASFTTPSLSPMASRASSRHQSVSQTPEAPRRVLKRKAEDPPGRVCACGTLLPPPDVYRMDVCDSCYISKRHLAQSSKNAAQSGSKNSAQSSSSKNVASSNSKNTAIRSGSNVLRSSSPRSARTKTSEILEKIIVAPPLGPMPSPGRLGKGKAPETAKSLRLQTETTWSTIAQSRDGAAGITFVNDVDKEQVPSTLRGDGWKFEYLEDHYHLSDTLGIWNDPDFDRESDAPTPAAYFAFCECTDEEECLSLEKCGCQDPESVSEYAYTDGLFNFNYAPDQVVVECNAYCHCSMACPNRVTQRPRQIPIEVFKTLRCGWGVRAPVDVERGRVLGVYTGKLIQRAEAEALTGEAKEYCFDLDYNEGDAPQEQLYSVDSLKCGNWTRFINHSCAPNLRVQPVVYDTVPDQNMAFLAFIATEHIAARTEFTFDYDPQAQRAYDAELAQAEAEAAMSGTRKRSPSKRAPLSRAESSRSGSRRPPGATDCVCGAPRCRGWVRTG